MENTVINNVVLDRKLDGYGADSKLQNFVAPQEITVTITLSEYRELVSKVATRDADINEANTAKWKREDENKKLKEEVAELKAKLYELQSNQNNVKEEKSDVKYTCMKEDEI